MDAAYRTARVAFDILQSSLGKRAPVVVRADKLVKTLAAAH
jgi:hypothetical protein